MACFKINKSIWGTNGELKTKVLELDKIHQVFLLKKNSFKRNHKAKHSADRKKSEALGMEYLDEDRAFVCYSLCLCLQGWDRAGWGGAGWVKSKDGFPFWEFSSRWRWEEKGTEVVCFSCKLSQRFVSWHRSVISSWTTTTGPNPKGLARGESSLEMQHDAEIHSNRQRSQAQLSVRPPLEIGKQSWWSGIARLTKWRLSPDPTPVLSFPWDFSPHVGLWDLVALGPCPILFSS